MERHVIFAHKLIIGYIVSALIGTPPALPIGAFARIYPFTGAGNIFYWGIKPNVKNFALHAGPGLIAFAHGHTPIQVACDAAVLQAIAIIEPLLGN